MLLFALSPSTALLQPPSHSSKGGPDEIRQAIVERPTESTVVVHWLYHMSSQVAIELLLKVEVVRQEEQDGENAVAVCVESVHEDDLDEHVGFFEDYASEIIRLELAGGKIVLDPAKHGQTRLTMVAQVSLGFRQARGRAKRGEGGL